MKLQFYDKFIIKPGFVFHVMFGNVTLTALTSHLPLYVIYSK